MKKQYPQIIISKKNLFYEPCYSKCEACEYSGNEDINTLIVNTFCILFNNIIIAIIDVISAKTEKYREFK